MGQGGKVAISAERVGAGSKQNQHNTAHLGLQRYFVLAGVVKLEFFLRVEQLF